MDATEPGLLGGMGSTSKQERPATETNAEQPPDAVHVSKILSAAPESLPSPRASAPPSKAAASSRSSSLSPQPSQQLHTGMARGQQEQELPLRAAPAAQAGHASCSAGPSQLSPVPLNQEEEPWQEVKASRRKPVSHQASPRACGPRAQKPDKGAPHRAVATSPLRPREMQAAAQHTGQAPLNSERVPVPFHAHLVHAAAEEPSCCLPALAGSKPQQPPSHKGLDSLQPPQPQAPALSMHHEALQTTSSSVASNEARRTSLEMPHTGLGSGASTHEQVRMLI